MIESYELAPEPVPPRLPGTVIVRPAMDDAIDAAAADLFIHARNCVRAFGDFHLAISVSPQVEPMLRRLMYDPPLRDIPWTRTHLWLVDEHPAPSPTRPANFDTLCELIVEQSDMPPEQAHGVSFAESDPALAYERLLAEHLGWREKGHDRLDFVLLGLPSPAEAAALRSMPDDPEDRLFLRRPLDERLSMTRRLLNASRFVALIAPGESSKATLATLAESPESALHPWLAVRPVGGELRWYLDHAACAFTPPTT
ncbi:MAG: 6-phosphogluconolactonase [Phycisphaerae bacterium]|nr:6-phosphogluconolactonase [Phycisphaerae bacterium]